MKQLYNDQSLDIKHTHIPSLQDGNGTSSDHGSLQGRVENSGYIGAVH